jgi:ribosome-binding factor A
MEKKDTNRIAKVNSLIEHELGPVLLEYTKELKGLVTITKVDTSRDMKWAKVWISIFNGNPHPSHQGGTPSPLDASGRGENGLTSFDDKILKFLAKNIYDIQGEVNKHFHTKIIPRISFHLDTGPRYAQHISELIEKIHEEK